MFTASLKWWCVTHWKSTNSAFSSQYLSLPPASTQLKWTDDSKSFSKMFIPYSGCHFFNIVKNIYRRVQYFPLINWKTGFCLCLLCAWSRKRGSCYDFGPLLLISGQTPIFPRHFRLRCKTRITYTCVCRWLCQWSEHVDMSRTIDSYWKKLGVSMTIKSAHVWLQMSESKWDYPLSKRK